MKEKIKDKKVIAGLVVGIIAIVGIVIFITQLNNSVIILKSKEIVVEYGEKIPSKSYDYIDESKMDKEIIDKIVINGSVDNEKGKEYPPIGEYIILVSYEDNRAEVKVIVQDTTAPVFKDFKEAIETPKDVKIDYEALYVVEDLSKSKVACEDGSVKYDTIGDYKATIKAIDQYQNEVKKEITVKIIEPTIKLDKESVSLYVKETAILKTTIVGKEQKAIFKSSDEKIASVDADGKVTAKSKGTATITATANGKEASCKVIVKEIPKGATTETKKDNNGNSITVIKEKNGTVSDLITSAKKYIGKSMWCGELIEQAFNDSNCDPNRYVSVGKDFMSIRTGDFVYYNNHVFLALGSPKNETHSSIPFKPEANMQELFLIEGGVTDEKFTSLNMPHKVVMDYGFFQTSGYRFCADTDENCKLINITRYK